MKTKHLIGLIVGIGLVQLQAMAGSAYWDFKEDPTTGANPLVLLGNGNGGGEWVWWDGADGADDGFLSITGPSTGRWAKIIFPDIDNGVTIAAFTFECMLRIGNGTASPADGFSINYARANDPTFTKDGNGNYQAGGWSGTVNEPGSTGPGNMAGLAEEGTVTGLAIGFDCWNSNSALWPADLNPGINDVIGISVRVDNKVVAQVALPTLNGACDDNTSLQTGPRSDWGADDWTVLCWQPFKVQLTEDKKLSIWWKGRAIVDNLAVDFYPSAGRLVFGGRTGDAFQNQHIDNIRLTTIPADKALVGNATADAISVTVTLEDAGSSVVDQSTVTMTVDGAPATPLSFSKEGTTTTVKWTSPTYLPSGKDLAVVVSFKDTRGVDITGTRTAKVAAYARIPSDYMVPTASVNKSKPGFLLRPYQTEAAQPNSLMWTEEQLLGLHGGNIADLSGATGGYYTWEGIINFNMAAPDEIGNFTATTGYEDQMFPGFPGTTGSTGNSTEEILTYVEFPTAGLYQLGVNSDDGFRVTAGRAPGDLLGVILGYFDGGRGSADTVFSVVVDPPGIYPIRLIWENGNGELPGNGANLEFFSVKDGVKIPVNANVAGALKAYRESTAAGPYVSDLSPLRGATGVAGNAVVMAEISHGSVQVDPSTMKMKLNGVEVPATVTTAGSKTTITRSATDLLPSASTQTVRIEFSDKSNPPVAYSTEWTFTVATYTVLPEDLWTAPGTGDATKKGFKARVWQVEARANTTVNRIYRAEQELVGAVGPNVADLSLATDGWFYIDGVINWDQDLAGNGNFGAAKYETSIPGIPGTTGSTDDIAAEIITYVEFPSAGFYGMGVNSDDGFKVTATDTPPEYNYGLVITGDPAVNGIYHAVVAPDTTAKPITGVITGKLVYMDPAEGCTAAVNAGALRGNIALIDRGTCQFSTKLKNALDAGAIAVVVANNAANEGNFPIEMGLGDLGYQDIPAVMISTQHGDQIKAALNNGANLTATIGPDTVPALGQFNDGRGASDTLFYFIVPKAGLYPFRCVWFEGGGGANIEWFSVTSSGQKILLNDPDEAAALKTYWARTVQPQPKPVISSIALQNGNVVITYTGVLQAADEVTGPYSDVAGTSPQTIAPTAAKKFYRARSK